MSATERGQLVTANRLRDGVVVFLTRSGQWSEAIDEAALALDPSWSRAAKLDPDLENMQASSTFQTIVAAAQARYQRLQQTPLSRPFVAPD